MKKLIDLKPFTGEHTVCIYGFPTSGKTSAQRCFRFLNHKAKLALGIDPNVHFDFTDTDEYFGVFKMAEQPQEKRREITEMMWQSLALATSLNVKRGHLSVIFTNFNRAPAPSDYDCFHFIGGFIPASEDEVRKSLKARQPLEYESEVDRYLEWYGKVVDAPLTQYLDRRGLLIRMQANEHMLNYLTYGGVRVPFVDVHITPEEIAHAASPKDTIL